MENPGLLTKKDIKLKVIEGDLSIDNLSIDFSLHINIFHNTIILIYL